MARRRRIFVLGAGGQARDAAWLIQELAAAGENLEFAGFIVSDVAKLGPRDSQDLVRGDMDWLAKNLDQVDGVTLGIGNPRARLALSEQVSCAFPDLDWPTLVHPSVIFDQRTARIGKGVMVAARATGSVNLSLGDFSLINIGVTLGHEASIGEGSVVNHNASISGGCTVGRGVLVGTGARVLQYLSVGDLATVGAGAVVTKPVAGGEVVVGVPAKPMSRRVTP